METPGTAPPLRYQGYIPGLDVLRGVAILMVVVYHATGGRLGELKFTGWLHWAIFYTQYGAAGVTLFFVLSGFLITGILLDTADRSAYYRNFYVRRALRILPAYLLMLAILKAVHLVTWRFVLAALLYIANMAGLVGAHSNEYAVLWSLAVEEQFYLLWPLVVRRLSLRGLTRLALGYFVFDFLVRLVFLRFAPFADTTFKLWFNAESLLTGALVALLLRQNLLRRDNIDRLLRALGIFALITFPVLLFVDSRSSVPAWVYIPYTLSKLPYLSVFTAMLLLAIKHNDGSPLRSPVARFLAFFGYISYGLYLVHQFVFIELDRLTKGSWLGSYATSVPRLLLNGAVGILISVLLAYLSRRFFEEYFLRKKDVVVPYRDPSINEAPVSEGT